VSEPYDIQVAAGPARVIQETLPEGIAAAVIEFITGSLIAAPRRVGKPLRRELAGLYAARRGTFRVLYRIDDAERLVTVVRVEHRADTYRRR
jgi:mRNA-degrading endonuclease RelE of RelBE toxin-antitoxin system